MNARSTRIATKFKPFLTFAAISVVALMLCQCSQYGSTVAVKDTSGYQANYGPFDSNGDYVESWADNPPKRRYHTRPAPTAPVQQPQQLAQNQWRPQQPTRTAYTPVRYTSPTATANHSHTPPQTRPTSRPVTRPTAVTVRPRIAAPTQHTVQPKETLYRLSVRYNTSVDAIKRANNLRNNNINIGQRLTIPRG